MICFGKLCLRRSSTETAWFSKAARKADIGDDELCAAIVEVMCGQADNLGGGVFKKRLNDNMYRSIILAKGDHFWVYEYLFAKQDRGDIDKDELVAFRSLAAAYEKLTDRDISNLLANRKFVEICNDCKT